MARNLKIRDLTLRDGQQSSFATRMNQAQIDRCLPFYKDANFYAMEVWGGAVPDSVMRYLNENPWTRLETIHKAVGNVSKLTALSRGRNLFGYSPYTDEIIDGFCRNAIQSGLGIMRIFDALNDVDNVKSTVKYVKQYGGIADCAVCYTVDPKYPELGFWARLTGKKNPAPVFTDAYFLDKARQMAALGADMITIKDMSGLIPPRRVATLVRLFKKNLSIPVDFHTHCTPGYGLASVLSAIVAGVDIVDTNCWYFAGGTGAPAIELVHVFCKKMGIDTGVNMEAVAKINTQLREIRKELNQSVFGTEKPEPKPFNPLTDTLPSEIDALFDKAIEAAQRDDEAATIDLCRKIENDRPLPQDRGLLRLPGSERTGAEGRDSGRHVFEHGSAAQAAQGRGDPAAGHGADPFGASGRRSSAPGNPDVADRRCPGRELCPGREGGTPDVYQQVVAVRRSREGRVRTYAGEDRPRVPFQDLRRA